MKRHNWWIELSFCGTLAVLGCDDPAKPHNTVVPPITPASQNRKMAGESTLSFSDGALQEIQRVTSKHEIDLSTAVIHLYLESADDGKRHARLGFEQRDKITERSHKILRFGGVPVAIPTGDVRAFDGIRVSMGERNGEPGFIFEKQSEKGMP